MDVWVQGWGLAALWVGALALVLLVILVAVLVGHVAAIRRAIAPAPARQGVMSIPAGYEDAKGPSQPEG